MTLGTEEILGSDGKPLKVGDPVTDGSPEPAGEIVDIRTVDDMEGHAPVVCVLWPGASEPEGFSTGVRDYRHEGPCGPYVYVCDDLSVA